MSASPAQRSFTPFPDLTGWRSAASCRSSSSGLVSVSHDAQISIQVLHEAARRLGAGQPADLVVAAWAIVLVRLARMRWLPTSIDSPLPCPRFICCLKRETLQPTSLSPLRRMCNFRCHRMRSIDTLSQPCYSNSRRHHRSRSRNMAHWLTTPSLSTFLQTLSHLSAHSLLFSSLPTCPRIPSMFSSLSTPLPWSTITRRPRFTSDRSPTV